MEEILPKVETNEEMHIEVDAPTSQIVDDQTYV